MRTTPELITALDRRGLLSPHDAERLRRLYENAPTEFSPRVLLKWLVNHERLTAVQADRILAAPAAETAVESLDRVLGSGDELNLEPTAPAEEDTDEDTKDLAIDEEDPNDTLSLPPLGAPTFAESEDLPPLVSRPKSSPPADSSDETTDKAAGKPAASAPISESTVDLPAEKLRSEPPARRTEKPKQRGSNSTSRDAKSSKSDNSTGSATKKPAAEAASSEMLAELLAASGASAEHDPLAVPRSMKSRKNQPTVGGWDSPLMLVGGAALLLLILGGAFLLWRIGRQGGEDAFNAAEALYRKPEYAAAVEKYDKFLHDYPRHASVGTAVVHRGLARVRVVVEAGRDWPAALQLTEQILAEVEPRDEFLESRPGFGIVLLEIAAALAEQALTKNDAATLALAEKARLLAEKYVGGDQTAARQKMAGVDDTIARAKQLQGRDKLLADSVAALRAAVDRGAFDDAESERQKLLEQYPQAGATVELNAAMDALARAAVKAARLVEDETLPATKDRDSPILASVVLADHTGAPVYELKGRVFLITIEGTLFAVDASDGRVLWRRVVGFDQTTDPALLKEPSGDSVVLIDSLADELVKVAAADGRLHWRHPLPGEGAAWFAVGNERIVVSHSTGRVFAVDVATGKSAGYLALPHKPSAPAVADPYARVRYQLTTSGIAYVLADADLSCHEAVYLERRYHGLKRPLCIGQYLIVFKQVGGVDEVHAFRADADGKHLEPFTPVPLEGRLLGEPQVSSGVLIVADTGGYLTAFDFASAKPGESLKPVAKTKFSGRIGRGSLAVQGAQVWLGTGEDLQRWELRRELGQFTIGSTKILQIESLRSTLPSDKHFVHAWRRPGRGGGANITAYDKAAGGVAWQAAIGFSTGDRLNYDASSGRLTAVIAGDGAAAVHVVAAKPPAGASESLPIVRVANCRPLESSRPVNVGNQLIFAGEPIAPPTGDRSAPRQSLAVVDFAAQPPTQHAIALDDRLTAPLSAFRDGVLTPVDVGQVRWLDPRDGKAKADPFQLEISLGRAAAWTRPAVIDDAIVVSDRATSIHRVEFDESAEPRLKARATAPIVRPLIGEPAAAGKTVYAVDAADKLLSFALPDLRPGPSWPLAGKVTWGPVTVGDRVYLATGVGDQTQCSAFDGEGELVWQAELPRNTYVPAADGAHLFFATEDGRLLKVRYDTGEIVAERTPAAFIGGAPIVVADQLILPTLSGELIWIAKP